MKQLNRALVRGIAVAIASCGIDAAALAALNEPYALQVAYDSAALKATLSWKADAPAVYSFAIERRPVGRSEWTQIATAGDTARTLTDAQVAPLTRYEYRVKSFRPGGPRSGYVSASAASALHFPYNRGYANGILPSNFSQAQRNADVRSMYDLWRATYVTTTGAGTDGARVYKPAEGGETVSEGQGYGMLISVYMADESNNGKRDFDKMLNYYKAHVKKNADGTSRDLMAWKINADGSIADPWVAPDGDLDAAFALLVADRKWGSGNGNPNYLGEAQLIINALQKYAVYNRAAGASRLIANADKDLGWQETATNVTNPSYQMVSYFKQFANASDSVRAPLWRDTLKAGYQAFDYFYKKNPATALTPYNFLSLPGPTQYQKTTKTYTFGPDSCRVPWRVGLDFLWHANDNSAWANSQTGTVHPTLAQDMPRINASWFMQSVGGNPSAAWYTYNLDGTQVATYHWGQRHTAGSMAVGAMTDAASQGSLNTLYSWMRQQIPGQDYTVGGLRVPKEYFGDTVLMINMIIATGNMPNLPEVPVPLK